MWLLIYLIKWQVLKYDNLHSHIQKEFCSTHKYCTCLLYEMPFRMNAALSVNEIRKTNCGFSVDILMEREPALVVNDTDT